MIAAVWVLLGAHLWGSESTQLTNLVMPAMVVALKVRADKAVTKVRKAAPKLVGSAEALGTSLSSGDTSGLGRDIEKHAKQVRNDLLDQGESALAPAGAQLLKRIRTMGNLNTQTSEDALAV